MFNNGEICVAVKLHVKSMISPNVTGFWKITYMGTPETIRIFEFNMALLIAETTFKNISKLYL